ncbi:MAG: 6-bladed beta-propeller [Bacteroidaceae bacterium]|nr:6-bladed beta-propeller [Bacteroidaceae bacterium]
MKKHLFYSLLMLISLMGCNAAKANPEAEVVEEVEEGLPVINLSAGMEEVKQLNLRDAVERVKIVKLETSDKSFLSSILKIEVTDNDIWITHTHDVRIYRFSHDGKFLNTVGKQGEGPEEYVRIHDFVIDDKKKEVYVIPTMKGIKVYDFGGNFLREQTDQWLTPQIFTGSSIRIILNEGQFVLSQNLAINFPIQNPKDSLWSVAVVDNSFKKTKLFKNPIHIGKENDIMANRAPAQEGWFNYITEQIPTSIDSYNNKLTFKMPGTDTIYVYNSASRELQPQYAITTNESKGDFIKTNMWIKDRSVYDYFAIANYFDTKDYIYLVCSKGEQIMTYCYDKEKHIVRQVKRQGKIVARDAPFKAVFGKPHLNFQRPFILNNNITGGDFKLDYRSSGKYWIQVLDPGSSDYEKYVSDLKKAPAAPQKQQLLDVIARTGEDDNPILLIAVLK